ncbi:hypothetical protein PbB2_01216 [Candidatus Phycosocius bacilliformis]|uniref:DUF4167 domain-containing protein n=1 Tax=Candidatus Phycosocius bacilliformis TaxID=1445552 RepID=A0A2P2E906_9PROT|nr:DUF4167 domain-containing protein [Candidatus Phycosocius bacilliformis]GBF57549.1 hypothetical protein PbB2_01216 [Candidatus Phycosocius bacilliformis]
MMKRQRGRGRNPGQKPQNNNPNRAYESNGPDIKVRGSAQTVFEKYQQLARDANSAGDRVLGENYLQHAEHYFRVLRAMQPTFVPRSDMMIAGYDDDADEGDEAADGVEGAEADGGEAGEATGQPDFNPARPPRENRFEGNRAEGRNDGDEDRFGRRRRRRRDRFGNEGPYQANGGDEGQGEPSRPIRHEGRPETGGEGGFAGNGEGFVRSLSAPPSDFAEVASFSEPQEFGANPEAGPTRERRPRPPRAPRAPRPDKGEDTAFGGELPAFLTAPVPTPSAD